MSDMWLDATVVEHRKQSAKLGLSIWVARPRSVR